MKTFARVGLLLLALGLTPATAFAQRVCVAPFTGPNPNAVRNQLITSLCDSADCVAVSKVTTANKPDWKKAKKEQVGFFITGVVSKKGKKATLTLQVLDRPGAPKLSKQFPLEGGDTLSGKNLNALIEALKGSLGAPKEEPVTEPVKVEPKNEPRRNDPQPPAKEPVKQPHDSKPPPPVDDDTTRAPAPAVVKRGPVVNIDVGTDILNRQLNYSAATSANLRKYDLPAYPMPKLGVEFYPLALAGKDGLLGGLGLEVGFAFMPALKTARKDVAGSFPTSTMRLDAGLLWKLKLMKSFALVPFAGVRLNSFSISKAADGTTIDGVPNISYTGLRAGLGVEFSFADELVTVFARFGVVPVFSSGEIISATWFRSGSTLGLDGAGGVDVKLVAMLHLRLAFVFMQYGLSLKPGPTDTYQATGATDRMLGGNVSVRLAF